MALAADIAEESLRALIIAAPRCCTVLMKSEWSHEALLTASVTFFVAAAALTLKKEY
jgi:hypothetical protein